uniref:Type I secretion outer membrane protein, TolC family n=1 Tax=Candidatus Kentrum sp. DK TaxID=2126562 RepID=A0A450SY21_9GAMM|nr:MAG: type I secretion outer membrane protein, TolC family [Candidatus Kentron sp. DK]
MPDTDGMFPSKTADKTHMFTYWKNQPSKSPRPPEKKIPLAIACLIGLLLPPVSGAVDLLDVYRLGIENDAEYRSAMAANRAEQEMEPQAWASLLPTVAFSGTTTANREDVRQNSNNQLAGEFDYNSKQLRLTISQPIFHKDLWNALEQAQERVEQADATLILTRQALMIRVAERYLQTLRARDDLLFAESEKTATEQQLAQAQQRFEVGFIAVTDIEETRAARDLAIAREIEAKNQLNNTHEALREVTGEYLSELAPLGRQARMAGPLEPDDIDQWTETALARNLEVAVARRAVNIAEAEIRRIDSGHLPTLDLVGAHDRSSRNGGSSGENDVMMSTVSLQLNVPLFQGGMVLSRSREAMHRHTQAAEELDKTQRSVHRRTRDAFLGIESGTSRIQALWQALQSTEAALDATKAGFEAGTRTSVDVLNAERERLRAKRDYAGARYDYVLDVLRLKQAAGTLSEQDLITINTWFGTEQSAEMAQSQPAQSQPNEPQMTEGQVASVPAVPAPTVPVPTVPVQTATVATAPVPTGEPQPEPIQDWTEPVPAQATQPEPVQQVQTTQREPAPAEPAQSPAAQPRQVARTEPAPEKKEEAEGPREKVLEENEEPEGEGVAAIPEEEEADAVLDVAAHRGALTGLKEPALDTLIDVEAHRAALFRATPPR